MKKIYSKINPEILLHIIFTFEDFKDGRIDISPENEFLQVAALKLPKDKTFKPHKHIPCEKKVTITQESWCIVKGSIKIIMYDLDDTIIDEIILHAGDLSLTFRGGHNYLILEPNTLVFEYKTPQYTGQKDDKVFI